VITSRDVILSEREGSGWGEGKGKEEKKGRAMRKLSYVGSLLGQVWEFARQNKVYWIVPFVLVLGLVVLLVVTSQAAAPFIYTLF
jgi:hypothetical protein